MLNLNISISDKNEIERLILILNIGLMNAINEGVLSIEEAENLLYSPYSVGKLENIGIDDKVLNLVKLGCELEDVESLIPDKLKESIEHIRTEAIMLLSTTEKKELPLNKWIK